VAEDAPAAQSAELPATRDAEPVAPPPIRLGFTIRDEELGLPVQVAPGVPRMCQTCRDFRPAESGQRGWCTNRFAFSHRRMVDADELPCASPIGAWWLPHDEVWLATADAQDHSQPTPLVDGLLAGREAERVPLPAAGQRRGRRRF
jgi:hypothetical protein